MSENPRSFYYDFCFRYSSVTTKAIDALNSEELQNALDALWAYTKFCFVESCRPSTQCRFYKQIFKTGLRETIREGTRGYIDAMGK